MADKKGIGIIGYGGFGEFIHAAWDKMDNARVVAVCDSDASRNPGVGVRFYDAVVDILADGDVDIVSIATPPSTHKDIAIQAMQAEKHVLVEKPIALTAKDCALIKRVSEQTERVATVNFVLRHTAIAEALKKIAQSGVLGKLRRMDLRNYAMQGGVPEGHWFWDPKISGRILLEHGVHFFDLASWINDSQAMDCWSLGVERKPGIEDRVFAAVKYENDVIGTFWHSFSRPCELERTTFDFAFDLGDVQVTGWIPQEMKISGWTDTRGLEKINSLRPAAKVDVKNIGPRKAHSSDCSYDVEYEVDATLAITEPKSDVYADSVRAIMADLICAIDDPNHKMLVTIDDAIEAVHTAQKATEVAHPSES